MGRLQGGRGDIVRQHTKLTDEQVNEIRSKHIPHHPDYSFAAFGRKFGVHRVTVLEAYKKRTWKKVRS